MTSQSILEGPWGTDFTFRRVQPKDYDRIVKHVQDYFLHDEPMSNLLGYTEEYGEEFGQVVRRSLDDKMSFYAEHNATGDVAAVRITFRHRRGENSFEGIPMNSRGFKYLWKFVDIANKRVDLFEYFELEEYADFLLASCATKYRKQGLASEMYRRSLKFLKDEGFKMAKSVFNSPYSRAAARNLNFKEISRVYFHEMRAEDGSPLFDKTKLNDEHYGSILCKRL